MRMCLLGVMLAMLASQPPAPAAEQDRRNTASAQAFGVDRVMSIQLAVHPKDGERMQPSGRPGPFGFGPGRPNEEPRSAEDNPDRKRRGMFGFDFEYVKAGVEIEGKTYKDVGVRFKGNATYAMSQGRLKRPLKIHLSRYVAGQNFKGLKKLILNNNVTDQTCAREVLSYGVYRALAVPCSRTAYAQLTLTVPGKYAKEFVGLYTLVEPIDKTFLRDRFGSAKGLLLKPEGVGSLTYLGEEWTPYKQRYRPKTWASKKAQRRLIEFTKLVQKDDDKTFAREIA